MRLTCARSSPENAGEKSAEGIAYHCVDYCINDNSSGDSGRARTCDISLRRRVLYPAELRSQSAASWPGRVAYSITGAGGEEESVRVNQCCMRDFGRQRQRATRKKCRRSPVETD